MDELSPADAAVLGLCACPCLTSLQLDSNGSSIGVAGAQGLAPLSQLQALLAPAQSLGDEGLRVSWRGWHVLLLLLLHIPACNPAQLAAAAAESAAGWGNLGGSDNFVDCIGFAAVAV